MTDLRRVKPANDGDPFLHRYQPSELKIASEFLTTWLPFLSRDLCSHCTDILADRICSLESSELDSNMESTNSDENAASSSNVNNFEGEETNNGVDDDDDAHSIGSWKDGAEADTHSMGSWKDDVNGLHEPVAEASRSALASESPNAETASPRMSWADMAQEDELVEEEEQRDTNIRVFDVSPSTGDLRVTKAVEKPKLSREQREYIRFMNVNRKKDFICLERVKGKFVNILEGLELHTCVFSAAEQKRIVDFVYELREKGRKGELKERTYSAPNKWMRGKGRVTIQFGCCYNYATDKNGNLPGILQHEMVDPMPSLFKVIIRRLVKWHVLPPTCVPDSCIVNIYEEADCIPPHIDNHDFVRPFCTVSFLSECEILFGSNLKVVGAGEFSGSYAISLPVGSVLVLNGNGADVAKHCVPAVPTRRISITFRKMNESKQPIGFIPEPDLLGIQPLPYRVNETRRSNSSRIERNGNSRQPMGREGKAEAWDYPKRSNTRFEPRNPSHRGRRPPNRRRTKVNLENPKIEGDRA